MKHKHEDYKLSAVLYHIENKTSYADTCAIFKCSERSLKRWLNRYTEEESIRRHERLPVAYKMKQVWVDFALKSLKRTNRLQLKNSPKILKMNLTILMLHENTLVMCYET